jgi:hypothetical protein
MNQDRYDLVKGSMARRRKAAATVLDASAPTQEEIDSLLAERITPDTDLPPMMPLFRMFDVPCFYRGELVADCGKAKSGKTFFLSILMAAALTGKALALERTEYPTDTDPKSPEGIKPLKVLWIDTEQSQQSTQEILKERIIPLAEGSVCDFNSTFYAFNLRGLGFDKRQKMVEVAVRTIKPDICIIDGIKDLMTDINDAVQATLIMEKLMALAKELNCCIVCVLHQNKAEQDRNMRGSIGTELTNKAFEVFQCEMISDNDKTETFKVTHTFSRKKKMKQKLYYRINDEGLPEEVFDYQEKPRDDLGRWMSPKAVSATAIEPLNEADLRKLFTNAMEGHTQRPFNEVMAIALKKCSVIDAKAYYHYLDQAVSQGIVRKEVHPETGKTWLVLDDGTLPF